ncbi:MAG: ABC-F family ATP-binding cassette domain-containing protein [Thermodesulfobacteriota bacterium]|nr:ABC-F family ATP-binding cassette domain-containing protein [Thermodesulfobacteriota bacterium]
MGARDRLGLVGPNGSGKTTLFRLITGEERPDRGEIFIRRGVQIGYLSQEPMPARGESLLAEVQRGVKDLLILEDKMRLLEEEISEEKEQQALEALAKAYGQLEERYARQGGYALEAQAKAILLGLGFREADVNRSAEELSGGWLMRLALAKILLATPDLLLLDEPTNHLDLESLIWLENFLGEYMGTIVVVSHDRDFLNRVVTKILAIEEKKINSYPGNYDSYVQAREKKKAILKAALDNQRKKIEQTEKFIERFRYKATKARQVQSRVKILEKLDRVEMADSPKTIRFNFPQPARSGRVIVELRSVHKAYGTVQVYSGVDLTLLREDKVSLVGPNGAGKSTLLKLLAGVLKPDVGRIGWGHKVTSAYFAQHQLELLDPGKTVWEEIFFLARDESLSFLRGLLGAFLFSGDEVEKKVSVLSGGEKSRLVLAKMLMRPANFLLLDEPSNHLDIAARDVLERALQNFQGALCFITHDRHLINAVANKVIEVKAGCLSVYPGNYDDYLYKKNLEIENAKPSADENSEVKEHSSRRTRENKRLEAEARNLFYRKTLELRQKIQGVEQNLDQATEEMEGMAMRLSDPEIYRQGENIPELLKAHAEAKKRVDTLTTEWETLAQQLEKLEQTRLSFLDTVER